MKKDFIFIFSDFIKNLWSSFSIKNVSFYKRKHYLSPARKIYLELHIRKNNLISFSLSEILFDNNKNFLTNTYFYPFNNVCWLLFIEINSKKFLLTREVLKTLVLCFLVVRLLDKEFKSLDKKSEFFLEETIAKKLKKISRNIKITYSNNF